MLNAILRKCTLYSDRDVEKKNNTQTQDAKQSEKRSHFFSFVPAKSERKFSRAPRTHTHTKKGKTDEHRKRDLHGDLLELRKNYGQSVSAIFIGRAHSSRDDDDGVEYIFMRFTSVCSSRSVPRNRSLFFSAPCDCYCLAHYFFFILLCTKEERLRKRYNVASMKREREHYFVLAVISVNYFSKICFPI